MRRHLKFIALLGLLLQPGHLSGQMQRDTVVLRSGNLVVGEIQSLRRGSLSFDTDEMDVVSIDWEDIATVTSPHQFEITLVSGEEYVGSFGAGGTAVLLITGPTGVHSIPFDDVVLIRSVEQSVLARTNGFIDLGTNLARANRLASILLKGKFQYQDLKWGVDLTGDSYWQQQESVSEAADTTTERTSRNSATLALTRFITGKWAMAGSGSAEQNEQLDLDRRISAFLGGGYSIIRDQGMELFVGGGGNLNDERYVGEDPKTTGEIRAQIRFDAFDVGDLDVYTDVTSFVTPTGGGRFRTNIDARIAWELIDDFVLGFNVTERLDSKPPSETATKRDYQYAFSIGWSWG